MYDKAGFLAYFSEVVGAAPNTRATYVSFLNRIDIAIGGLDEALASQGGEKVAEWAKTTEKEPFATYRSHARSVLKRYSLYRLKSASEDDAAPADFEEPEGSIAPEPIETDANFLREKEMQVQVRQQLTSIESGLTAVDGSVETTVATGRIDILAKDGAGKLVVIELKAGKCPAGALEQLLAYAYDIEQEKGTAARAMLIAGSFTDRQRAAARRAGDVELKTYAYSLSFQSDD